MSKYPKMERIENKGLAQAKPRQVLDDKPKVKVGLYVQVCPECGRGLFLNYAIKGIKMPTLSQGRINDFNRTKS